MRKPVVLIVIFSGCVTFSQVREQANDSFDTQIRSIERLYVNRQDVKNEIDICDAAVRANQKDPCRPRLIKKTLYAIEPIYGYADHDKCFDESMIAMQSPLAWDHFIPDYTYPDLKSGTLYPSLFAYEYLLVKSHNARLEIAREHALANIDMQEMQSRLQSAQFSNSVQSMQNQQQNQKLQQENEQYRVQQWRQQNENSAVKIPYTPGH